MKKIMMLLALFCAMAMSAQDYNSAQEALRRDISVFLQKQGISSDNQDDGLKIKIRGVTYYIEIDKEETNPMLVCLRRYVKYSEDVQKEDVAANLNTYNAQFGVKVLCREKAVVISAEMYVTEALQFNDVFNTLLMRMETTYESITD